MEIRALTWESFQICSRTETTCAARLGSCAVKWKCLCCCYFFILEVHCFFPFHVKQPNPSTDRFQKPFYERSVNDSSYPCWCYYRRLVYSMDFPFFCTFYPSIPPAFFPTHSPPQDLSAFCSNNLLSSHLTTAHQPSALSFLLTFEDSSMLLPASFLFVTAVW